MTTIVDIDFEFISDELGWTTTEMNSQGMLELSDWVKKPVDTGHHDPTRNLISYDINTRNARFAKDWSYTEFSTMQTYEKLCAI